jgi:site-specific DNA-adenine methylase
VGGKYKLLKDIIPLFPEKINTFVDLFGGGFNVGVNVNAERIIYNELCNQVVELMNYLKDKPTEKLLKEIDDLVSDYKLSKENRNGFLRLRAEYNNNPTPIKFYTLICYAFNYQIRFNQHIVVQLSRQKSKLFIMN